jgi:hypothetical protein
LNKRLKDKRQSVGATQPILNTHAPSPAKMVYHESSTRIAQPPGGHTSFSFADGSDIRRMPEPLPGRGGVQSSTRIAQPPGGRGSFVFDDSAARGPGGEPERRHTNGLRRIDHHAPPAPELLVVNKIDAADDLTLAQLRRGLAGAAFVSARTGEGVDRLRTRLGELVEPREVTVDVTIPYSRGDLVARLHDEGRVDATEHHPDGTRVKARVPAALAAAVGPFAT